MKRRADVRSGWPRLYRLGVALGLSLCPACPGTIDDPESFYAGQTAPTDVLPTTPGLDAGGDAGLWTMTPAASDGGWSAAKDAAAAGSPQPTDAGKVDAVPDSGTRLADASAASADAATDAGSGCNFKALMQAKCGSSSCHGTGGAAANLDLVSDGLAARVAGRKGSGACGESLLIDTDAPEDSALYRKVTADACGARMPLGGALADAEQACILRWIEGL